MQGHYPSPEFRSRQEPFSLAAALADPAPEKTAKEQEDEDEDGLFAMAIGPRSPEMAKSPFSFGRVEDTVAVEGKMA
jgi:hypothetical protein